MVMKLDSRQLKSKVEIKLSTAESPEVASITYTIRHFRHLIYINN